jgi:hypothetical protein
MIRVALLLGLLALLAGDGTAQSMKKKTGPVIEIGGLKSQTYDFWKAEKVAKPVLYSFKLPKTLKADEKDIANLTIQPTSQSLDDFVAGIKGKFQPPAGYKIDEVTRVMPQKNKAAKLTAVYIRGSYEKKPGYAMLAGYLEAKDGKYAIELVGPSAAVGTHQSDFYDVFNALK